MYLLLSYFFGFINNSNDKDLTYYIAKYIIEHILHFEDVALQEIADGCFVSVPTVKQFFKRFNYSNYTAFKTRLLGERDSRKDQIYRGYQEYNLGCLQTIAEQLSCLPLCLQETIDMMIEEISKCRRIIVIGSPTIVPILANFQTDMTIMGKMVVLSSLVKGNGADFDEDDLIVMISGTGRLFSSEDALNDLLGHSRNRIIVFSGDTSIQSSYNIIHKVNIVTRNEMFETEYLLLYYFDVLRWTYYKEKYEKMNEN